jgi:tRNA threonylcarbamoyladenosine biosynthesis protein TsaB
LRSIILGIDSSDDFLSVGLSKSDRIIFSRSFEPGSKNKNMLHQHLCNVLDQANVSMAEIEAVALAIGPGSFTGLRVGLAVAKGICWSLSLPLVGVSSLLAIAHCARKDWERLAVVKDARRNEFYYAAYQRSGENLVQAVPDSVGSAEELLGIISRGFKAVGPGVAEFGKFTSTEQLDLSEGYDSQRLGGAIALLGRHKLDTGETLEVATAAPLYIRNPNPKEWKP